MTSPNVERDYVLGTHDEEIARLGVQHRVWRDKVLDVWTRAGFTSGQTIADIGCGPGYATLDLAEIVGPTGRVIAIDRSRRFLDALESTARGLFNITTFEHDLDADGLPDVRVDATWCRWVAAFVKRPRDLAVAVHRVIRPGGVAVFHEYLDYAAWRLLPRSPEFEEFVRVVIETWRASGGEPDIGLNLGAWLEESGFQIEQYRPIVEIISPADAAWQWPQAFFDVGLRRLVDIGAFTAERAAAVEQAFRAHVASPHARMLQPIVGEIVARRR
ncbi:MAG TPA: methyltransferase domain-containing protein [Vicinamibacterales bacterium]|nr:methyltransferase domain-containing protein [Vicinamibacterales bacterium]